MSAIPGQVTEIMVRGLKEILHPHSLPEADKSNPVEIHQRSQSSLEHEVVMSRNLSKSVKSFVEQSLSSEIDSHLKEIRHPNKQTWKIDAHNLSKVILYESKLLCLQDNLNNIVDSCLKEVNDPGLKYLNDSELDFSPLLQPEHIIEVAECMSSEKPLDVRLNALRVLLRSHFTEAVHGNGWLLLQKKLVENLCDSNIDIFITCLKAHAKMASSSSSEAIKECALNLLESLGQSYHQHTECKILSFQSMNFYRMVYTTRLLLDIFKEATLNVARFGESKLEEIINNLIQLLSLHVPSKQPRNKQILSPLEVLSYLDPNGHWLINLTHFNLTQQLFLSSISQNIGFLRITIEEMINWLNDPIIPSRNTSKVMQGELTCAVYKYSMFCHCLSVFTIICSSSTGFSHFPININKREDKLSVEDILRMLIALLNDSRFNEMLFTRATDSFKTLFAHSIAKLLCLKDLNGGSLLMMLLKTHDSQQSPFDTVKIKIFEIISQYKHLDNPFLNSDVALKRKIPLFVHCFISTATCPVNHSGSIKQRRGSVHSSIEIERSPYDVYLNLLRDKLKNIESIKETLCLMQITTQMFSSFGREIGIDYALKAQITQLVAEMYIKLQESLKQPESKYENEIDLSVCSAQYLLQMAGSTLGFYMLNEIGVVKALLCEGLRHPVINWFDPLWLLFVSKSTTTKDGCEVLATESSGILKKELAELWTVIEKDCSGSELPVENSVMQLLKLIVTLSLNVGSIKALLNETRDGSDITLTEEHNVIPSSLYDVIQHFALNEANCPDFIHHQFALTVLEILTSNIDSSIYLQHRLKYQDILLQLQSENRVDENTEVIIDECSLLRHKIIEQYCLPGRQRIGLKPTHTAPRPESTLARAKPRSRGTGELARWLNETRLGLHDNSWLKHARKLYRNSSIDDMKGTTIVDLLEQVFKVLPEHGPSIQWQNIMNEENLLQPEDELAIQLVMRYGVHHRLVQFTQLNSDNLTHLILSVRASFKTTSNSYEGFDWFAASAYLLCSGNIDKSQTFLNSVLALPTAPLLWPRFAEPSVLAQLGDILDTIIAEEMPAVFMLLRNFGISWWHLCCSWINQCWWNVLDWPQICYWLTLCILHQPDQPLYFCVAILQANHDRLLNIAQQGSIHEIITNPVDRFQLADARVFIDKLHKNYHNLLHCHLLSIRKV